MTLVVERPKLEKKIKLGPPIFIINFKLYKQGIGENALKLAQIIDDIAHDIKEITFVVAVNFIDLVRIKENVSKTLVFAQHVDPVEFGAFTGHISPSLLKEYDIDGTLINHSERKIPEKDIKEAINLCKKYEILQCVCAGSVEKVERLVNFTPTMLAYEPPELIGTGIAVSKAQPEILSKAMNIIQTKSGGRVIPLCGAGISSAEDAKRAVELGAKGILVASAIVKSKTPAEIIEEMAIAMLEGIS